MEFQDNQIVIPLSNGMTTIVDEADADLGDWQWHAQPSGMRIYAARNYGVRCGGPMHRVIMKRMLQRDFKSGEKVDHIDNNPLNNTRDNLRVVTHAQNMANQGISKNNTSGYKGVTFKKTTSQWEAGIWINGKRKYLGLYDTPQEAHEAYKRAAIELHGEYARWE